MVQTLPQEYLENMRKALSDEFGAFLAEYEKAPVKALRFNTKKVRPETVEKLKKEWQLEPVPWCPDGYYYEEGTESGAAVPAPKSPAERALRPGLSPYHQAGVFYIQEPSAMLTAERAEITPDDIVLDLCAAPGGKSTQAAAKCKYLVSNEPIPGRARILSSNIERMGFGNVIVCSAYPDRLADCFHGFFTKIIVDAPCSGEGMMRKDETAVAEWSPANVAHCVERQAEILESAAQMLAPGGRLVYSTCTFEYDENDGQMLRFLSLHPEFRLISSETMYPHKVRGEGHFCAVLEKEGATLDTSGGSNPTADANYAGAASFKPAPDTKAAGAASSSSKKKRKSEEEFTLESIGKLMQKKKIHVLRCGVEPGETITDRKGKKRYEPSHAEALAGVFGSSGQDSIDLLDPALAESYLKGNTLDLSQLSEGQYRLHSDGGWLTVMFDGYPMGLGKLTGSIVKNHYPKGLRHM